MSNEQRTTSEAGFRLIRTWEAGHPTRINPKYLRAYRDVVGVWTIGFGHTNLSGTPPRVVSGMVITAKQAEDILRADIQKIYEPILRRNIKVELTQHQWDAMVSWVYNLGEPNLRKSRLLKMINQRRFDLVPGEIMKWTRAGGRVYPGLVNRRRDEVNMWRGSVSPYVAGAMWGTGILSDRHNHNFEEVPHGFFNEPQPEPVTRNDNIIEQAGAWSPVITTFLAYVSDWKVAAVFAAAAVVVVIYFAYRNRQED